MKKILSVILAVMMLFGALSVGASAISIEAESIYPINDNQVILSFNPNGGTFYNPVYIYDAAKGFYAVSGHTGAYIMIPQHDNQQLAGNTVILPLLIAPSGQAFNNWYCTETADYEPAGVPWTIPESFAGEVLHFTAHHIPAEPEEDTMATVMNILIKVFGAIIGILLYGGDTEAGVAMMEKVLGGLDL